MSSHFYAKIGNTMEGPFDAAKLKQLAAAGQITVDHLISRVGESNWVKASRVKGLFPVEAASNRQQVEPAIRDQSWPVGHRIRSQASGQVQTLLLIAAALVGIGYFGPRSAQVRWLLLSATGVLVVVASLAFLSLFRARMRKDATGERKAVAVGMVALLFAAMVYVVAPGTARAHPIFSTPVTGLSDARPAIKVHILDEKSHGYIYDSTYDLYLAVHTSRSTARVLFPLNTEGFQGCNTKFIQLPFEVDKEDELVFELLYQSGLNEDEKKLVLSASRDFGYCLIAENSLHGWAAKGIHANILWSLADVLGRVISESRFNEDVLGPALDIEFSKKFNNLATTEHIIDAARPSAPYRANKATLIEDQGRRKLGRADVQVYYPKMPLE